MANDISPQLLAQRYFEEAESDTLRLKSGTSLAVDNGSGTSVSVGPGVFDAGTLTIASGVATLPAVPAGTAIIRAAIGTEAAAATDDLDSVGVTGSVAVGTLLILEPANDIRDVTVKANTTSFELAGHTDFTLNLSRDRLVLVRYSSTAWVEVARSSTTTGLAWSTDATGITMVFNENGSATADLRVEGDSRANLLFVDASADSVYIATSSAGPGGTANFEPNIITFNSSGIDQDFRVLGDNDVNLIRADASVDSVGIGNGTPTAKLHIGAGSTAAGAAPLKLTTGSLLITPEAGAIEYLTNIPYFSGAASQRGVVDTSQFVFQSAAFTLPNNNSLNACFTAAQDTFTVQAATTYILDAWINLTTGATTHTTAFGLLGAGASTTFTSINILASCTSAATGGGIAAPQGSTIKVSTAQVLDVTSPAVDTHIKLSGSFQVNAAGTIIPSIQFSADPTGTCQTNIGSYFRITPIGSNTVTSTGPWA